MWSRRSIANRLQARESEVEATAVVEVAGLGRTHALPGVDTTLRHLELGLVVHALVQVGPRGVAGLADPADDGVLVHALPGAHVDAVQVQRLVPVAIAEIDDDDDARARPAATGPAGEEDLAGARREHAIELAQRMIERVEVVEVGGVIAANVA